MLKEMVASNAAKLIAACVCPVVGTAAVTMSVPKVRSAVHRMTAPDKPVRTARAKPRMRLPAAVAEAGALPASAGVLCPDPVILTNNPLLAPFSAPAGTTALVPPPSNPTLPARVSFGGTNFIPAPGLGGGSGTITPPPAAVPEPTAWAQMIVGFGVLGGASRVAWRSRWRRQVADV